MVWKYPNNGRVRAAGDDSVYTHYDWLVNVKQIINDLQEKLAGRMKKTPALQKFLRETGVAVHDILRKGEEGQELDGGGKKQICPTLLKLYKFALVIEEVERKVEHSEFAAECGAIKANCRTILGQRGLPTRANRGEKAAFQEMSDIIDSPVSKEDGVNPFNKPKGEKKPSQEKRGPLEHAAATVDGNGQSWLDLN